MLNLWKKHPIIGGKGATGHGRVKICIDFEKEDEEKYLEFLHSNKPGIVTVLDKLCGDWKP
ncbi:MAG: hypothetical protein DDT40_00867 [candidate division WS2 bacterium]|nr:hypothetical protein [Candidatus Psychracetigena formicireducens]